MFHAKKFPLLVLLLAVFPLSCGVKEKPVGSNAQLTTNSSSIGEIGALFSSNKKFLVRPSTNKFVINDKFSLQYNIVQNTLEPLSDDTEVRFRVGMFLPGHKMEDKHAHIDKTGPTQYTATMNISMEGQWTVILSFVSKKDGSVIDDLSYNPPDVPPEQ